MKKIVFAFIMAIAAIGFIACSSDNNDDDNDNKETVANPETPTDGSKILVAYFLGCPVRCTKFSSLS